MWAQKVRNGWILKGDRNTRLYQTVVRQRRAQNRILQLQKSDGCLTEDQREIEDILVRHFRQSYEGSVPFEVDQILEEIRPCLSQSYLVSKSTFLIVLLPMRKLKLLCSNWALTKPLALMVSLHSFIMNIGAQSSLASSIQSMPSFIQGPY